MTNTQQLLSNNFPQLKFEFDKVLKNLTYFKIGGPAEVYLELDDEFLLAKLIKFCHEQQIKVTILGGASNIIVADEGIEGLALKIINDKLEIVEEGQEYGILLAGAGVKMPDLVKKSLDHKLTGLEYFYGVPGTLGGAIYNNAHYLEDLIGKHVEEVKTIDQTGNLKTYTQKECDFSYEHSIFQKNKEVIFEVTFKLHKGSEEKSQSLLKEAIEYRAKTQPLNLPSSGCIFQNYPNNDELKARFPQFNDKQFIPAGFLIDQAGLKGSKIGDLEVSQKHAAFFVNHGAASAQDVRDLINLVKKSVKEKFNVELQEEVFFLQ